MIICAGFPFSGVSAFILLDIRFLRCVLSSFLEGFLVLTIDHSHKLVHTMSLHFLKNGISPSHGPVRIPLICFLPNCWPSKSTIIGSWRRNRSQEATLVSHSAHCFTSALAPANTPSPLPLYPQSAPLQFILHQTLEIRQPLLFTRLRTIRQPLRYRLPFPFH